MEKPTVHPSILVTWGAPVKKVCHFFMRDGKIQYLPDSTHELSGKTVDMVDYDDDY